MKSLVKLVSALVVLAVFAASSHAQKPGDPAKTPLRQLSSKQLIACMDKPQLCGESDFRNISDELVRRIPSLPSDQLVACFDNWRICGSGEGQASGWPISDELARRKQIAPLLARYWTEPKPAIRDGIEHVAYHFDTPEVLDFMHKVFARKLDDEEDFYWPINYLAKKCDPDALKELATGRFRNAGCIQYQTSVALFGTCKYRPAVPYLVDTALQDFCGNVIDAADDSLRAIYSNSPKNFESLEQLRSYYCARAKKDGFRLDCK